MPVPVFGQDKQPLGPMRFVLSSAKDGLSLSTAYFVSLSLSQGVHRPNVEFQIDLVLRPQHLDSFRPASTSPAIKWLSDSCET